MSGTRTRSRSRVRVVAALVTVMLLAGGTAHASSGDVEWTRQFGTSGTDIGLGVAVAPDGSVYVVGGVRDALPGQTHSGGLDAFVRKYSPGGQLLWTRQFGNDGDNIARGVAVSPDGTTVYVVGETEGGLSSPSSSPVRGFVQVFASSGDFGDGSVFGPTGVGGDTVAHGVAVGLDGSIYVVGDTRGAFPGFINQGGRDAYVLKRSPGGGLTIQQFGTSASDTATGVAARPAQPFDGLSQPRIVVVGNTEGDLFGTSLGSSDAYLVSFRHDTLAQVGGGTQFGTSGFDAAWGVAAAPANVQNAPWYVVGSTQGTLPGGGGSTGTFDAYIVMHDLECAFCWIRQFGTGSTTDAATGVAVGSDGAAYVVGRFGFDAFVRKYERNTGNVVWSRVISTSGTDTAFDAAMSAGDHVYVVGQTTDALPGGGGKSGGIFDAFVRKYGFAPTVGLVDPTQGRWHLRNSAGQVTSFFFGNPGDVPFMGDWNCDGIQTPGLYRQSDGFVYLRNSNTQGNADITFFFGNPGDVPIAGDFNGDGCDTVSIYRPSNQTFFIINALGEDGGGLGAAETSYVFGNPGDKPFTGDFNGNGVTTVGLHREATGFVYFRNTHTQGNADAEFFFGDPGDRFVAGDWNGNGTDTPAVFRPSNTTFFFRFTNTQGIADDQFVWGEPGWLPVAGRFGLG